MVKLQLARHYLPKPTDSQFPLWHGKVATALGDTSPRGCCGGFRFGMVKLQPNTGSPRRRSCGCFRFGMVKLQQGLYLNSKEGETVSALAW